MFQRQQKLEFDQSAVVSVKIQPIRVQTIITKIFTFRKFQESSMGKRDKSKLKEKDIYKAFGHKVNLIPWDQVPFKGYKDEENQNLVTIEASVVTGFECAALEEVKSKLQIANVQEFMGRIVFDIGQEYLQKVLELRCIDNVLVIIGAKTGFDFANLTEEQSLEILTDFSMNLNVWMKGLSSWNRVFEFYQDKQDFHDQEKRPRLEKIPTFRCTCYRTGENLHKFSSMDVARVVGGKVQEKFGWGVKMKNFDIEYVINVDENQAYAGIGLTRTSLYKRNIEFFGPTTLRATICASMLQLANIQPGEFVCDPMCGGGSIPIEGAMAFQQGFYLAGDYHDKASERTINNLKHHQLKLQCDAIQWDATNIPLRDNCVDVLISDLVRNFV